MRLEMDLIYKIERNVRYRKWKQKYVITAEKK